MGTRGAPFRSQEGRAPSCPGPRGESQGALCVALGDAPPVCSGHAWTPGDGASAGAGGGGGAEAWGPWQKPGGASVGRGEETWDTEGPEGRVEKQVRRRPQICGARGRLRDGRCNCIWGPNECVRACRRSAGGLPQGRAHVRDHGGGWGWGRETRWPGYVLATCSSESVYPLRAQETDSGGSVPGQTSIADG